MLLRGLRPMHWVMVEEPGQCNQDRHIAEGPSRQRQALRMTGSRNSIIVLNLG